MLQSPQARTPRLAYIFTFKVLRQSCDIDCAIALVTLGQRLCHLSGGAFNDFDLLRSVVKAGGRVDTVQCGIGDHARALVVIRAVDFPLEFTLLLSLVVLAMIFERLFFDEGACLGLTVA